MDNCLLCLRILTVVAEDCPVESLERWVALVHTHHHHKSLTYLQVLSLTVGRHSRLVSGERGSHSSNFLPPHTPGQVSCACWTTVPARGCVCTCHDVSIEISLLSTQTHTTDSCILLSCYSCLLDPPSSPAHSVHQTHLQVTHKVLSRVMTSRSLPIAPSVHLQHSDDL